MVTDDGATPLSATNTISLFVSEMNLSPALPVQHSRTVSELAQLTVANGASDADLPANVLTYQLVSPPAGAVIDSSGVITWTPGEAGPPLPPPPAFSRTPPSSPCPSLPSPLLSPPPLSLLPFPPRVPFLLFLPSPFPLQGPGAYSLTTVVTDNGTPSRSATNSFTVTVTEVNSAPVLPVQGNRSISELTLLTVTNTAADADVPANVLSYQLIAGPAGSAIDPAGVIT